jgi:heat shock protein HtpX
MPLTFIDIERQKNWRIWLFFLFLLALYLGIAAAFAAPFFPVLAASSLRFWIASGAIALAVAGIHFWFAAYDTAATVMQSLNAQPPDLKDDIHKVLANVIQEVHVVTGNQRTIQGFVIPSLSMNALAVADLKGNAAIGITEGLLSRLTRPQIETVVAHEAHHILSGDCLETTVAASLFGTFTSALEKLRYTTQGRSFAAPGFILAWLLLQLSYLLNLFISREREYRADAAAIRMSRNPIALAETLHLLSRSWRGAGFIGSGFEMLCIVNPIATTLDESEGFWADLLSTHPPLKKRINILLAMARVSITELDARADARANTSKQECNEPGYYAMNPQQQWQGPFTLGELDALPWFSPLTWITNNNKQNAERAWKQPIINDIFSARLLQKEKAVSDLPCPACKQHLVTTTYHGTSVFRCSFCAGTLVENNRIPRIIARTGPRSCTDRVTALARTMVNRNQLNHTQRMLSKGKSVIPTLDCPKCGNAMLRSFYSSAHLIEIDRCLLCGYSWFDQDELEMLQCLIQNRIVPDIG